MKGGDSLFARLVSAGTGAGIMATCASRGWTPDAPGVCKRGAAPAGYCYWGDIGVCATGPIPGVCAIGDWPY